MKCGNYQMPGFYQWIKEFRSRQHGVPRTLDEMAEASINDRAAIAKTVRKISRVPKLMIPLMRPEDLVDRFGTRLGLDGRTRSRAREILRKRPRKKTSSKSPLVLCATALYVASNLCGEAIPQEEIAETVGTTGVSIRNTYQLLNTEDIRAVPGGAAADEP